MRLIDADAFTEQYGNYYAEEGPEEGFIGTVGDLIAKQPTIKADIDRAAILRLCNEIEDEVTDIAFNSTHYHIRDCCEAIRKYLEEIGKELTGNAGAD